MLVDLLGWTSVLAFFLGLGGVFVFMWIFPDSSRTKQSGYMLVASGFLMVTVSALRQHFTWFVLFPFGLGLAAWLWARGDDSSSDRGGTAVNGSGRSVE